MSKEDLLKQKNLVVFNGVIAEILPNRICKVKITDETTKAERVVICYVAGKFEEKKIKINLGDAVRVEFSIHNFDKGRIVFKYKKTFDKPIV